MAENTNIEWCDATFNPWIGCTKVSTAASGGGGCDNCYAAAQDRFRHWTPEGWGGPRKRTSVANWRKPVQWNAESFFQCQGCGWRGGSGDLDHDAESASSLTAGIPACPTCNSMDLRPARRRVFCASLADVFDNQVPEGWRVDLFRLIRDTPNLDWLMLTKRIGNAASMIEDTLLQIGAIPEAAPPWPWPTVWLGATVVNQEEADRDIPKLLATPARVRFLSMEPLLGPVILPGFDAHTSWCPVCKAIVPDSLFGAHENTHGPDLIDRPFDPALHCSSVYDMVNWIIVGGESGHGARPMHPDWARSLRDQCAAAGVSFLFKQWGEFASSEAAGLDLGDCYERSTTGGWVEPDGAFSIGKDAAPCHRSAAHVFRVGKKAAGRLLDGRTHDGYPEVSHAAA